MTLEHRGRCRGDRTEGYDTTSPSGDVLRVERCMDCGEATYTPTGRNDGTGVAPPMTIGDVREPVGPEDALDPGPKRGDYSHRIGDAEYHQSVAVPGVEPGSGQPVSKMVAQRPHVEEKQ